MTRSPLVTSRSAVTGYVSPETHDSTIGWRFVNPRLTQKYYPYSMGQTAENMAGLWKISREEQDIFALSSHEKYFAALVADKWKEEILPVEITGVSRPFVMLHDEPPRKTTLEKLAALKPAFVKNGTVTAGNSSGINDGAAVLLMASEEAVKLFGLQPMARVVSMSVAGVDPAVMGIAPVPSTLKALRRAGLRIGNMDLVELSEAFASQSLACIRDLDFDSALVNVNGGSIALGHPLGSTGARIAVTLLHEMKKRHSHYGLATTCVGVGQGVSMIYEGLF
jgi:acetyl-CoA C-acetyltransferase